jgi:nucleotide-binding universal stress UspA family protein
MMVTHILVPLDRREPSEAILPFVADIADRTGATVRLVAIRPIPHDLVAGDGRLVAAADIQMTRLEAQALDVLTRARALLPAVPVECVVRFGAPVREIALEAQAWPADLIALSETEESGWRRLFRVGLAARIRRRARVPVLLYRPLPSRPLPAGYRKPSPVAAPAA